MTTKTVNVKLRLEKLTKGAVRFQEIDPVSNQPIQITDGAKIGTLYVRKSALDGDEPQVVDVRITYDA